MEKAYLLIKRFNRKLRLDDISVYASSIAFFLFLSLIPLLVLICYLIPYTPMTESDLMVVVGSKKSANTTHLAQILESITKTIHIEHQNELDNFKEEIAKAQNIGVTAGASTPDTIINAVIEKLENIN